MAPRKTGNPERVLELRDLIRLKKYRPTPDVAMGMRILQRIRAKEGTRAWQLERLKRAIREGERAWRMTCQAAELTNCALLQIDDAMRALAAPLPKKAKRK